MSADNGIYLLKTKDQYRVKHCTAIDNLYWDYTLQRYSDDLIPTRVIEYFSECKFTRHKDIAYRIAFAMEEEYTTLEYGINTIKINKTWDEIIAEAKELAQKEIKIITEQYNTDCIYIDKIKQLEKIINM